MSSSHSPNYLFEVTIVTPPVLVYYFLFCTHYFAAKNSSLTLTSTHVSPDVIIGSTLYVMVNGLSPGVSVGIVFHDHLGESSLQKDMLLVTSQRQS